MTSKGVIDEREADGPTPVSTYNLGGLSEAKVFQIHASVHAFATLLSPSTKLSHTVLPSLSATSKSKLVYVQLVQTSGYNTKPARKDGNGQVVRVSGGGQEATLAEGDGVFISGAKVGEEIELENVGGGRGELILFEMDG